MNNKNYIVCAIFGGLGNQILQYSFAKSLALKLKCELYLDLSFTKIKFPFTKYKRVKANKFKLSFFKIKNVKFFYNFFNINFRYVKFLRFFNSHILLKTISKKKINSFYYEDFFNSYNKEIDLSNFKNNSYYYGYWQKILLNKYLDKNLFKELDLNTVTKRLDQCRKKIDKHCVAIHIRGGDYLNEAEKIRRVINENYYRKSIEIFKKKVKKPIFYIFTDDVEYAYKIIKKINLNKNFIFINKYKLQDIEEFWLMKQFKNFIISNSTFSLSAAFFSKKRDKILISPKLWLTRYKNNLIKKNKNNLFL
jgi:hypothetical protein